MTSTRKLPEFVEPMLATRGKPFDSDDHVFEIKWDGFRALAIVGDGPLRVRSRRDRDLLARFPEAGITGELDPGIVIDGELVAFRDGSPDFEAMLEREQVRSPARAKQMAGQNPVAYVVFDLLYQDFVPILDRPLRERRERLQEVVRRFEHPRLVFSDGIAGAGTEFFAQATEQGLEGIVAKKLDSPYLPGKRTDLWTKIKRSERAHCAIIGYVPAGENDIKSVIVATNLGGELRAVGKVGSGLTAGLRARLLERLRPLRRDTPLVPTAETGIWVEPELYCTVTYVERTRAGNLRAPVFGKWIEDLD